MPQIKRTKIPTNIYCKFFTGNRLLGILILFLVVISCDSSDDFSRCIEIVLPEIDFNTAAYDVPYYEHIVVEGITDYSSSAEDTWYYFNIDGELPKGINNKRYGDTLVFYGTPEEVGEFTFKIDLYVEFTFENEEEEEDEDWFSSDPESVCYESDPHEYTILVL